MNSVVKIVSQTPGSMTIQLNRSSDLDLSLFRQVNECSSALSCLVQDEKKGEILYSTEQMIPLSDFLREVNFRQEEAYRFLELLLEQLIFASRNQIVFSDPQGMYIAPTGNKICFAPLPVKMEFWPMLRRQMRESIGTIVSLMQGHHHFEILGMVYKTLEEPEYSLSKLLDQLRKLEEVYCPKKFWQLSKQKKPYCIQTPVEAKWGVKYSSNQMLQMEQREDPEMVHISQNQPRKVVNSLTAYHQAALQSSSFEEIKTEVIASGFESTSYLEFKERRIDLDFETCEIGRHPSCKVCLDHSSVSLYHARITCDQGRYYVIPCKTTNGTFLDGEVISRRRRLKKGMKLQFGTVEAIFHE